MPRLSLALTFAVATLGHPAPMAGQVDTLRYALEYRAGDGAAPTVAVELRFRGDRSGRSRIVVPSAWGGETGLDSAITTLDPGPGVTLGPGDGDERTLIHKPGAPIRLRYVLHQDWAGPLRYPLFHRVILDRSRVAFNQATGLVYPEHAPGSRVVLQVQWSGLPDDWRIISSFGSKAWCSTPISWREFSASFFAAGDFRLVAPPGLTGGITIAAQGSWRFTDRAFTNMVGSLWNAEEQFWHGQAFDRAFVLLLPLQTSGTVAGTAFIGGFFAVSDTAADLEPIGRLLAHELFHLWNGQRMAAAENEVPYKWFTEGITDYYADRIFRSINEYSDSEYRARVNAVLRRYYSSPERGSTRAAVAERYWSNDAMKDFPYAQGYAFGLYLQTNLPRWTRSPFDLDSLMAAAYRRTAPSGRDVADTLLIDALPAAGRRAFADALAMYIDGGAMVPADSTALGRCATTRTQAVFTFDLGFDEDSSRRTRVISGVKPGGPAAAAGIADGMRLLGWSWNGDANTRAILQVDDGHGPRQVSYAPHDNAVFLVPQYVVTPERPGCAGER